MLVLFMPLGRNPLSATKVLTLATLRTRGKEGRHMKNIETGFARDKEVATGVEDNHQQVARQGKSRHHNFVWDRGAYVCMPKC